MAGKKDIEAGAAYTFSDVLLLGMGPSGRRFDAQVPGVQVPRDCVQIKRVGHGPQRENILARSIGAPALQFRSREKQLNLAFFRSSG